MNFCPSNLCVTYGRRMCLIFQCWFWFLKHNKLLVNIFVGCCHRWKSVCSRIIGKFFRRRLGHHLDSWKPHSSNADLCVKTQSWPLTRSLYTRYEQYLTVCDLGWEGRFASRFSWMRADSQGSLLLGIQQLWNESFISGGRFWVVYNFCLDIIYLIVTLCDLIFCWLE